MKRKWNERTAETDRQSTGLLHTSPLSAFCPSVNESVNQSFISQSHTKHTTIAVQVSPDRNSSPQQQRLVDWFDSFPTVSFHFISFHSSSQGCSLFLFEIDSSAMVHLTCSQVVLVPTEIEQQRDNPGTRYLRSCCVCLLAG